MWRARILLALISLLLLGIGTMADALDAVEEIKKLRINSGPYTGGFQLVPFEEGQKGRFNWYFTNFGLLPIVRSLNAADLEHYIRTYLDLYLSKVNEGFTVEDVNFPQGRSNLSDYELIRADSDDSYPATLFSLAVRYVEVSGNESWWHENVALLKHISYATLGLPMKPNNLTSCTAWPRNNVGYLMDNSEVYRGLSDFARMLHAMGDDEDYADYCDRLVALIVQGLGHLFKEDAFLVGDHVNVTDPNKFYADLTCQVFPQAFGVSELSARFDAAWAYLNRYASTWPHGGIDAYPWAILGYTAALRGQNTQAQQMVRTVEQLFLENRPLAHIGELGWYQRIKNLLAGQPDI